ncbi:ABC transporter substrate-binding protein [Aliamphritea spongicola]|uniref:ABC transporter substrate-binding protein n=1 Tax=Aliamphritea spongicola TaxID=707589 RepID=UPI00196B7FCA|nr:ABC transporter substrate-binding protein [Aliamphritea spongicola]MBN3562146.1 ABC transporter substrate-binding protein [Aliamphritea spongicola]
MRIIRRFCIALTLLISTTLSAAEAFTAANPAQVYMVVWRGCEEACEGFKQYIADNRLPVELTIRDAAKNKASLPGFIEEARQLQPDLVVTWGTSVSKAIIGPVNGADAQQYLQGIPLLFMIVADPVGAGIIKSYTDSGRPLVTGIRNRVPEQVQLSVLQDYLDAKRIGVIYAGNEANSVLNTRKLESLAKEMNFELLSRTYELGPDGQPLPDQLDSIMAELKSAGADAVYVGSSSYNRQHRDAFTQAANSHGLPVASAYDVMVTRSDGLIAVANRYYNVGRLAANQAEKVLFKGEQPGQLPIASLNRYSIFINMQVARQLELYPPIQLLKIAELVNVD